MITVTKKQFLNYETVNGEIKATYYTEGFCVSSDTKPTGDSVGNGSSLIEMDTGEVYFFDAEDKTWRKF